MKTQTKSEPGNKGRTIGTMEIKRKKTQKNNLIIKGILTLCLMLFKILYSIK